MNDKTTKSTILAAIATATLTACGGGGGGTAGIDRTGSPTPVVAAAYGTVTGFGSVIVNGVRYDTSSTQFRIDGSNGTQNDLAVGDVVLVQGSIDANATTGVAAAVTFDDQVQGPIATINATASTLVVLGQTVRVGADTSFDNRITPASLAGVSVGQVVEVSGFVMADGSIEATRIEPKAAGSELELTGAVSAHDGAFKTFSINSQAIDYSAVTLLQDFPASGIANGQTVEVKGGAVSGTVWRPARIELKANGLTGAAGARREIEGFISRFGSSADFTVAGMNVITNAQTAVTGGSLASLALNVKVEVEGALDSNGVLVATKVDIRRAAALRVAGVVDSVDGANGSFTVLGITVRVDALTRVEDKSSQQQRPFSVANLVAGNYVIARGGEQAGGIIASLVERHNPDPDTDTELQGFVQTVLLPNFSILGVQITTGGATIFRAANGNSLSSTQFFQDLNAGDLVKAKGLEIGTQALQAAEAEYQN